MSTLIYGASGLTGRLVARKLAGQVPTLVLAGRDRVRLEQTRNSLEHPCEVRVAHVHDKAALRAAFTDVGLVINCSGPSTTIGELILATAIEVGAHYLDCSGEQPFIRAAFERYEAKARKRGVVAVNGLAFEVGLGDWLASLVADELGREAPLTSLSVAYAIDNFTPTHGTKLSILRAMQERGVCWIEDRWERTTTARELRALTFPAPFGLREGLSFPSGEIVTIPRHISTKSVSAFISPTGDSPWMRTLSRATSILGPAIPSLLASPLGQIVSTQVAALSAQRASTSHRGSTRFAVLARGERSFERRERVITGGDLYETTARILAYCANKLGSDAHQHAGVFAPSQVFDAAEVLGALSTESDVVLHHEAP